MFSQHYESVEASTEVPAWVVFVTIGVLAVAWAVSTLTIEAHVAAPERNDAFATHIVTSP